MHKYASMNQDQKRAVVVKIAARELVTQQISDAVIRFQAVQKNPSILGASERVAECGDIQAQGI